MKSIHALIIQYMWYNTKLKLLYGDECLLILNNNLKLYIIYKNLSHDQLLNEKKFYKHIICETYKISTDIYNYFIFDVVHESDIVLKLRKKYKIIYIDVGANNEWKIRLPLIEMIKKETILNNFVSNVINLFFVEVSDDNVQYDVMYNDQIKNIENIINVRFNQSNCSLNNKNLEIISKMSKILVDDTIKLAIENYSNTYHQTYLDKIVNLKCQSVLNDEAITIQHDPSIHKEIFNEKYDEFVFIDLNEVDKNYTQKRIKKSWFKK